VDSAGRPVTLTDPLGNVARTDSSGTSSFLTDALGSTLALADSTGTVQTSYTYDPFGNPSSTGAASSNTQQYTGRETDGTGLQYNRARYYSPTLQRFISEDPLGFGGGDANLYAYVGNDPINATDPSGQFIEVVGQCLFGAAINVGFGYATSSIAGRKYTAGDAARDGAIGCAIAVIHPFALVGEGSALVGDVAADDGAAIVGEAGSALASGGEDAAAGAADAAAGDAAAGTCSFSGETPVATTTGETSIDQIQPGDQVDAYDPATGQTGPHTVTAVWRHTDQITEDVTVDGEHIETTPEHPFYVEGAGWVPAGALWVGAAVRRENGQPGVVQQVTFDQQAQTMYNLTVETAHTFFVGQQQILVHNTCNGYHPNSGLPRGPHGDAAPDSEYPHTQLGTRTGRNGQAYKQAREWGENGQKVRDIEWTDHGRPTNHPSPHQHIWDPATGARGKTALPWP
jgi:RHS repeat-associated protein